MTRAECLVELVALYATAEAVDEAEARDPTPGAMMLRLAAGAAREGYPAMASTVRYTAPRGVALVEHAVTWSDVRAMLRRSAIRLLPATG